MHLLLVGISHRTAPVELRERVDFQARGLDTRAARARPRAASAREAVVLSTCNRAELYAACDDVAATRAGSGPLRQRVPRRRPPRRSRRTSTTSTDLEVARHLFRVAAGLDSLVVGEPQILGQVKDAHTAATDAQTAGPVLNRLFHCVVRRRQARAHRNRPRLGRGVGELRRGRARAQDLRRPQRPQRRSSSAPARWAS